jgi:hypothetical protein
MHRRDAIFILLNPSTADGNTDDATIRRCVGFAQSWGCNGLRILNLFALRSTDPKALYESYDPVGAGNDHEIKYELDRSSVHDTIVAAWGVHGRLLNRDDEVRKIIAKSGNDLYTLGKNIGGSPRHPLYLRADTKIQREAQP